MSNLVTPPEFLAVAPKQIKRPCDHGLDLAIIHLETQIGTVEAYNRLCIAAGKLREQIGAGKAKAPNPHA